MTGKRTVAYIGDSTFFHSGLPALANALKANDEITVAILDNFVTAMTGFQPSPTSGGSAAAADGEPTRPSIVDAVRGLGVRDFWAVDPFEEDAALAALKRAKGGSGVNVIVFQAPCVVNEARARKEEKRAPFEIDGNACNACSLCVRVLGCPAILISNGEYVIDPDLCDGCELCARVCGHDAIRSTAAETV